MKGQRTWSDDPLPERGNPDPEVTGGAAVWGCLFVVVAGILLIMLIALNSVFDWV